MIVRSPGPVVVLAIVAPVALGAHLIGALGAGCGPEPVRELMLSVTSQAPFDGGAISAVRLLFYQDGVGWPADPDELRFEVGGDVDPEHRPWVVRVRHDGATFGDGPVAVLITGWSGGRVATRYEGTIELGGAGIDEADLMGIPGTCDTDGDGFLRCDLAGCCAAGGTFPADCRPDDASDNPWRREAERCDGADNDCDGLTDETPLLGVGEACDGDDDDDCPGGKRTCSLGALVCTGDANVVEVCNGEDDDCDGLTDLDDDDLADVVELCNGLDDDCDGTTDEGFEALGTICDGDDDDLCEFGELSCNAAGDGLECVETTHKVDKCVGDDDDCDGLTDLDDPDCSP